MAPSRSWTLPLCLLAACASGPRIGTDPAPPLAGPSPEIEAAVRAGDRTEEDRALDGGRRPVGLLTFIGVRPGQRVAELGAGGGYTSELLARVVGEQGAVFMHNAPRVLALIGSKRVDDRLARPAARPEGGFPGRPTAAPARPATLRSYPLTRML